MKRATVLHLAIFLAVVVLATPTPSLAGPIFRDGKDAGGSWALTGSLHTARISPMAVTLPSGKVLVTGGFNNPNSFSSSELWDPATGKWSMTGSMHVDRSNATLTLLATGKVLVAGGLTSSGVTAACELYDPATSKWTATGSLHFARYQHTSTLLLDGRVLVSGGIGTTNGQSLQSGEIYNTATGRWIKTAFMNAPRQSHTASLLANGDVLVTGGDAQFLTGSEGSTEIYDVARNRWTIVGRMTSSRFFNVQTTLADGSVIVAGGAFGDESAYDPFPSTDRFDPATGVWSPVGDMQVVAGAVPKESGRTFFTATPLASGMVLAAGGIGVGTTIGRSTVFSSAELFDPSTGTWSLTADMNVARAEHAAVELSDGRAMVISGTTRGPATATAEIFTPSSNALRRPMPFGAASRMRGRAVSRVVIRVPQRDSFAGRGSWKVTGSMHFAREGEPAVLLQDGRVLVEGCTSPFNSGGTSAELFDPSTGKWTLTGSMNVPRCRQSAALLPDGRVLVVGGDGGSSDGDLPSAEIFDPATGTWSMAGVMNSARTLGAIVPLPGGTFLIPAGAAQGTIPRDSADTYDPSTGTFASTPSLNVSRYGFATTPLADGRILVEGGTTQDDSQTTTCEIYDPVSNTWTMTEKLANQAPAIVLLLSGEVLAMNMLNGPSSELFDPMTGVWTPTKGSMHILRNESTSTALEDGRVLVAGGQGIISQTLILQTELYDPVTQDWVAGPFLHSGRWAHSAVRLADGRVLVVGGLNSSLMPIASAEIYTP